jgi:hypothetical protein
MSDHLTIHPTHHCFDDVTEYLNALAEDGASGEELRRYTIVHGIIVAPDGTPTAHAWLEIQEKDLTMVIQAGIVDGERVYFVMPRAEFLAHLMVWDETRYTIGEALQLDQHLGRAPWVPEYREICSRSGKAWIVVGGNFADVVEVLGEAEALR